MAKIGTDFASEIGQYIEAELNNREFGFSSGGSTWSVVTSVFSGGEFWVRLSNESGEERDVTVQFVVKSEKKPDPA